MVALLICLVLVLVAIVVVIRLLLAELARSSAYRPELSRDPALDYHQAVKPAVAKAPVSAARAGDHTMVGRPVEAPGPIPAREGDLLLETSPRPRQRDVGRVTKVVWWRRLRSGTALVLMVALLGIATAAVVGAIVLFFAFVFEQAIN